ncbi:hypothetical protein L218DRAFT_857780 [Marasmius fiardii PR-910]|nr:hypothetical protein L218DRAFT_857780 [Marasmius fiardii PR-910]
MAGPMPNIISLPYGRCPPLHFQAPNWRHLLMLMARLPGTRVEPTVEAMAQNKFDMRLRTVIQFVRSDQGSSDWRTIIWLTIDHPVPPGPQTRKYANNDVDVLPFSYTLSPIPPLLQNNADTPVSKIFTVPSTDSKPYPTLPISFPNLALYLQETLEESRRYMSDSSSGFRKLVKMIQLCYPSSYEPESGEGGGVGKLFKKFGRGNKKGRKGRRGGNEETYELVTPFVSDEWDEGSHSPSSQGSLPGEEESATLDHTGRPLSSTQNQQSSPLRVEMPPDSIISPSPLGALRTGTDSAPPVHYDPNVRSFRYLRW